MAAVRSGHILYPLEKLLLDVMWRKVGVVSGGRGKGRPWF